MVNDSLLIICGNCGRLLTTDRTMAKAEIDRTYENELSDIFIYCENCDTLHSLNKYMDILE